MSKCIDQRQSERYISKMSNEGVSILNPPSFIKAYINYKSLSARQKTFEANTIATALLNALDDTPFPRFYMLNLIIDLNSNKHAMLLVLDYNKTENVYTLELFDSNGDMSTDEGYEGFVYSLVRDVKLLLEKHFNKSTVNFIEVRQDKSSINVVGDGNCDALVIYFASLRHNNDLETAEQILDNDDMDAQRMRRINEAILNKQSLN
tara:strand:- start:259 stop:876 length:618 start_codon:yes stop_codon:yes gene_type:complete